MVLRAFLCTEPQSFIELSASPNTLCELELEPTVWIALLWVTTPMVYSGCICLSSKRHPQQCVCKRSWTAQARLKKGHCYFFNLKKKKLSNPKTISFSLFSACRHIFYIWISNPLKSLVSAFGFKLLFNPVITKPDKLKERTHKYKKTRTFTPLRRVKHSGKILDRLYLRCCLLKT